MEAQNRSTHIYSEENAKALSQDIIQKYSSVLEKAFATMNAFTK